MTTNEKTLKEIVENREESEIEARKRKLKKLRIQELINNNEHIQFHARRAIDALYQVSNTLTRELALKGKGKDGERGFAISHLHEAFESINRVSQYTTNLTTEELRELTGTDGEW